MSKASGHVVLFVALFALPLHGCEGNGGGDDSTQKDAGASTDAGDGADAGGDADAGSNIAAVHTVGPSGGSFGYPDGLTLHVPAGALTDEQEIRLTRAEDNEALLATLDARGVPREDLVLAVEGEPSGTIFAAPLTVVVEAALPRGAQLIAHDVDLSAGTTDLVETTIGHDAVAGTVSLDVHHFSTKTVEQMRENELGEAYCAEMPCRCDNTSTTQSDLQTICDQMGCQATQSELTTRFLNCEGEPPGVAIVQELSEGCVPSMSLDPGSVEVGPDSSTTFTATVELACGNLEAQSVSFSVDARGTVSPTTAETNADGQASTSFTAGQEEGAATLTARADMRYVTRTTHVQQGATTETISGPERTESASDTASITIARNSWTGTLTYDYAVDMTMYTETASYDGTIEFDVVRTPPDDTYPEGRLRVQGTAQVNQMAQVVSVDPDYLIESVSVPPTLSLNTIGGWVDTDGYVSFQLVDGTSVDDAASLYSHDYHWISPDLRGTSGGGAVFLSFGFQVVDPEIHMIGRAQDILLEPGTYAGTMDMALTSESYSLTISRAQ